MQRSDQPKLLAKFILVGVVYFAAVRFSLDTIVPTQLWPASGIGLAAILRWGPITLLATIPGSSW